MKIFYLIILIVAICKAQESLAFCDDTIEYDLNYYGKFISHLKLSKTTDIILADKRLIVIDDELNILSSLSIPKKTNDTCEWIFKQSPELIFVGCQKSGEPPYLISYKSINNTHFSQFGDVRQFPNLYEDVLKITGTLNTLFTVSSTQVRLFTLFTTKSEWNIQTTEHIFDKNYFRAFSDIKFVDLSFAPFSSDNLSYYKLIVVEQRNGAYWVDTVVNNSILQPVRSGRIYIKSFFYYFVSAFIHSTTQDESVITFIHTDTYYSFSCRKVIYQQDETSSIILLYFDSSPQLEAKGSLIQSGNAEGILFRNSDKQSELWIYNVRIDPELQQGEIYKPIDKFKSSPQDYSIYYFNTGYRVVFSIENNKLQSCNLYNYKVPME